MTCFKNEAKMLTTNKLSKRKLAISVTHKWVFDC